MTLSYPSMKKKILTVLLSFPRDPDLIAVISLLHCRSACSGSHPSNLTLWQQRLCHSQKHCSMFPIWVAVISHLKSLVLSWSWVCLQDDWALVSHVIYPIHLQLLGLPGASSSLNQIKCHLNNLLRIYLLSIYSNIEFTSSIIFPKPCINHVVSSIKSDLISNLEAKFEATFTECGGIYWRAFKKLESISMMILLATWNGATKFKTSVVTFWENNSIF